MIIRPFMDTDIEDAGLLAMQLWEKELPHVSKEVKYLIYQYLVRYYYYPQSEYCFCAVEGTVLQGILLAYFCNGSENSADEWVNAHITNENRSILENYRAYLMGNRVKEHSLAFDHEIILALFATRRKGVGKLLIQALEEKCRKNNVHSMLLWTDETCNISYYRRNRFSQVACIQTFPTLGNLSLTTCFFRKYFSQ